MQLKKMRIIIFTILLIILLSTISNASSSFLNITLDGDKMKVREIPILMNGKIIKSESPSFLYVDRTLVSARLIAENYGAKVGWNKPTETVKITHDGNIVELKINSDKAKVNGKNIVLDNSSIPRLVNFGGDSAKTMVPLTFLADVLGYETDWDDNQKAAYLKKKDVEDVAVKPDEKPVEKPIITSNQNSINGIIIEKRNGKDSIVVKGNKKVKYNILKLSNPSRLVVDIMDSELLGTDYMEKKATVGNIIGVRASQFVPDQNYNSNDKIVRVVVDIADGYRPEDVKVMEEGNNFVITPGSMGNTNNVSFDKNTNVVTVNANKVTNFNVDYKSENRSLTITAPIEDIDIPNGKIDVLSPMMIDFEVKTQGNFKIIIAHFRREINYNVTSGYNTNKLQIQTSKGRELAKHERVIVIDPGHGGTDPGTSSASGIREKNIALSVSQKLRTQLQQVGYSNILMTREDDKALVLASRPEFANNNYADILISIHANSVGNSNAVSGIEVLYAPKTNNFAKGTPQTDLAKFIQAELIKSTGAVDRKTKQRPNLVVLRDSKMAAVLIETGFLSNPNEAAKLNDSAYQDKMVDAIVRGIEKYFSIYD